MAAEIIFEFDEVTVKSVEKKLGRMKSEAPKALKNALNATAKDPQGAGDLRGEDRRV